MSPEDFRNYAQGGQTILLGIAIISGGIWGLFRYLKHRESAKATTDLEKAILELQKVEADLTKAKRELEETPFLQLESNCDLVAPKPDQLFIQVVTNLKCIGTKNVLLDFSRCRVTAAGVVKAPDGTCTVGTPTEGGRFRHGVVTTSLALIPGESAKLSQIVPVEQPGLYVVEVSLVGSHPVFDEHEPYKEDKFVWDTVDYIAISPRSNDDTPNKRMESNG